MSQLTINLFAISVKTSSQTSECLDNMPWRHFGTVIQIKW